MINDRFYLIELFDFYGKLLTEKQQIYFKSAYFNDCSLSEIANLFSVSKNAIHDSLKTIILELNRYESVLKLKYKHDKMVEIIDSIDDNKLKEKILKIEEE